MDNSFELEESKDEAARALLDPAQVKLHALASGIMPAAVRRRLVAHVAGAPLSQSDDSSMFSTATGSQKVQPGPSPTRHNRLRHAVGSGPIVAYIRKDHR